MNIVLAHGVLGFGVLGPFEYFNGLEDHIGEKHTVHTAIVSPIGSIEKRGRALAGQILKRFKQPKSVHVLAHSMGGLDARWALRNVPGLAGVVTRLVMIGTPHLGSPVADAIQNGNPAIVNDLAFLPIRQELRVNQAALRDLTTTSAAAFEKNVPDVDGVAYRYVAGDATQKGARFSLAFRGVRTVFGLATPSDGVVPLTSANRGRKDAAHRTWPLDHAGLIGWNLDFLTPAFIPFADTSHFARYDDIINNLL